MKLKNSSLVEARKNIIEKKNDAVTWQEKERAWNVIEGEFNCFSDRVFRDAKHLKLRYEALKRDTRKKARLIRVERYKTGGGSRKAPPLTPVEQKIKEMILLPVEGEVAESEKSCGIDVLGEANVQHIIAEETFVFSESNVQTVNVEEALTSNDAADYSSNIVLEVPKKLPTKRCITHVEDAVPSTSFTGTDQNISEPQQKKWSEWKPASFKSKKRPALCKSKEKRPFDRLAERKLEVVSIQKQILKEELEEKLLKKQLLINEIQHSKEIHDLQKEELLLKIEILKMEFENKKKLL